MADLILTSNTTYEAVDLINGVLSGTTGLWTSGTTGSGFGGGYYSVVAISNSANTAIGEYSYASGSGTTANGLYGLAFAEGELTTASGYGHSIGSGTTAGLLGFAGGISSIAAATNSFCFGENNNTDSTYTAIVGGQQNSILEDALYESNHTAIFVGSGNTIRNNLFSFVGGGLSNKIESDFASFGGNGFNTILGGSGNTIYNGTSGLYVAYNAIAGGSDNEISDSKSCTILGGETNIIKTATTCSVITSSSSNINLSYNSVILGGASNNMTSSTNLNSLAFSAKDSAIIGGSSNTLESYGSSTNSGGNRNVILGGEGNTVKAGDNNTVIGGRNNTIGYSDWSLVKAPANNVIVASENCDILGVNNNDNNIIIGSKESIISGASNSIIIASSYTEVVLAAFGTYDEQIVMGYAAAGSPSTVNKTVRLQMWNGYGIFEATPNVGPADYAEYFEWNDGNTSNEDSVGYFVSLVGGKIEKGNFNIVGIVSSTPAIVGDSSSLRWKNMYLQDDFDRIICDSYEVYEVKISGETDIEIYVDEKNNKYSILPSPENIMGELYDGDDSNKEFVGTKKHRRMNPNFNKNEDYINRENRKEWSPVGLLGKIYVKTSEQITGNKIGVDTNGMAINGSSYCVLEKIKNYDGDYGIVKVLFKLL